MTLIDKIQALFPRTTEIPAHLLNDIPCIQTGYLVNGEIREWGGPRQEVFSPVRVAGDSGPEPFFIGEYPLLTETQAFQALDAAVAAGVRRFVFASSVKAMGEETPVQGVDESLPCRPTTAYGRARLAAETLLERAAGDGLGVTVLRAPLIYGPGVGGNLGRLLRAVKPRGERHTHKKTHPLPAATHIQHSLSARRNGSAENAKVSGGKEISSAGKKCFSIIFRTERTSKVFFPRGKSVNRHIERFFRPLLVEMILAQAPGRIISTYCWSTCA